MKIVLIPGLFSSFFMMEKLKDRLKGLYPTANIDSISSSWFTNVSNAKEELGKHISDNYSPDEDLVIIGHSFGGQLATHFIDDSRVKAVVTIGAPSHNPMDYPFRVWPIQNLYFFQSLFNFRFRLKEKHRAKLFGGVLPDYVEALSYGWLALQVCMGAVLGNFAPKVKSVGKLLAFYCDGDPTILPKVVKKLARRYHGREIGISCPHHYPILEDNKLDLIVSETQAYLTELKVR
ncbi:MAG: alpha/beta hydrolase [bacterium]